MGVLVSQKTALVDHQVRPNSLQDGPHLLEHALVRAHHQGRLAPEDELHIAERARFVSYVFVRLRGNQPVSWVITEIASRRWRDFHAVARELHLVAALARVLELAPPPYLPEEAVRQVARV